jgi:hypothetical protein
VSITGPLTNPPNPMPFSSKSKIFARSIFGRRHQWLRNTAAAMLKDPNFPCFRSDNAVREDPIESRVADTALSLIARRYHMRRLTTQSSMSCRNVGDGAAKSLRGCRNRT